MVRILWKRKILDVVFYSTRDAMIFIQENNLGGARPMSETEYRQLKDSIYPQKVEENKWRKGLIPRRKKIS